MSDATVGDLEDFFENGAIALHIVGPDGTILRANKAELSLLGYNSEEYVGHKITDFHADGPIIDDILKRLTCGEKLDRYPARLRAKDGSIREVEITSSVQFKQGQFLNTRCFTSDVTEKKSRERHLEFVMSELSHRSKNLLAIVQSIAKRTIRSAGNYAEFEQKFMSRIQAMARMHDVLVANQWVGADVNDVVRCEVAAFLDEGQFGRITLAGDKIFLTPTTAQNLSLAVHELTTNSLKYGALAEDGRVAIGWRPENDSALSFTWREQKPGGAGSPTHRGFGSQLLETLFKNPHLDFSSTGFAFSGVLPLGRQ